MRITNTKWLDGITSKEFTFNIPHLLVKRNSFRVKKAGSNHKLLMDSFEIDNIANKIYLYKVERIERIASLSRRQKL